MLKNTRDSGKQRQTNYFEIVFRLALIIALTSAATAALTYFDVLKISGQFAGRFLVFAAILQLLFWLLSSYTWQRVVSFNAGVKLPFIL